jgi:hypothetical protein
MFAVLLAAVAAAVPPSSTLTGPTGTLSWTVDVRADGVHLEGRSPKWKVVHDANADLTPRHTEHTNPDGATVVVEYTPTSATAVLADGKTVTHLARDLWDGDTVDVRLGARYAAGTVVTAFSAIDPASGKLYRFDTTLVGTEDCAGTPCGHVLLQLTGVLRWVGPSFHYWYRDDGQLLRFEGPAGAFVAR